MSQNTTNPGCVNPASQAYPAPSTRPATPTSRNVPATSSGEIQTRCAPDVLSSPSSSGGSGAVTQSDGEQQILDRRPAETSVTTSRGLPANLAAGTPAARGLPADVVIK